MRIGFGSVTGLIVLAWTVAPSSAIPPQGVVMAPQTVNALTSRAPLGGFDSPRRVQSFLALQRMNARLSEVRSATAPPEFAPADRCAPGPIISVKSIGSVCPRSPSSRDRSIFRWGKQAMTKKMLSLGLGGVMLLMVAAAQLALAKGEPQRVMQPTATNVASSGMSRPRPGGVALPPNRLVATPLSESDCAAIGGSVTDVVTSVCLRGKKCVTADEDGVIRSACITDAE